MTISEILVKYFGKNIMKRDNDRLIKVVESKIKDMHEELDYLTTIVNSDNVRELEKDTDEFYFCENETENAAFVINMTTSRIKELEGVLLFLLQNTTSYEAHVDNI